MAFKIHTGKLWVFHVVLLLETVLFLAFWNFSKWYSLLGRYLFSVQKSAINVYINGSRKYFVNTAKLVFTHEGQIQCLEWCAEKRSSGKKGRNLFS